MIPKIVHYVWLGRKELTPLGKKCLTSWQKFLPGWEIHKWTEDNSPLEHPFVARMLRERKYAFASDYIRLHALAKHGGLYLDTDMELVGDVGPLLNHLCVLDFLSVKKSLSVASYHRKPSTGFGIVHTARRHRLSVTTPLKGKRAL